ncbi:DUF3565 domain-containing protein [Granulicella sibirica]|uniref:DUF3565 domain-containing protein n=1 Tax=Granulicella sibirica TaxID=2479048 RepID=UPI003BAB632C
MHRGHLPAEMIVGERRMESVVVDFRQDEAGDWIMRLACGHERHVRHDPPWTVREWVLTPEGRAAWIGRSMPCPACVAGAD